VLSLSDSSNISRSSSLSDLVGALNGSIKPRPPSSAGIQNSSSFFVEAGVDSGIL